MSDAAAVNRNYGPEDAAEGKAAAKAELRRRMSLGAADVPVVAVVTRLTHQKGIHLIKHAAWRTLERGAQFVLLGSAPDPKVQARGLSNKGSSKGLGGSLFVSSSGKSPTCATLCLRPQSRHALHKEASRVACTPCTYRVSLPGTALFAPMQIKCAGR